MSPTPEAAVVVPDVPPPPPSPLETLAQQRDWEGLAALGPDGLEALKGELRRIAAMDSSVRVSAAVGADDPRATWPLVRTLAESGDPTVPGLLAALLDEVPSEFDPLRGYLFEGLARTGSAEASAVLVAWALPPRHRPTALRNPAANALESHPLPGIVALLAPHVADADPEHRAAAAHLLGGTSDPSAVPLLVPVLTDSDPGVRAAAATALGDLRDEAAVLPLLVAEERDRRERRHGHGAAAYDGRVSVFLVAVDDIVGGDDASTARWRDREHPLAVEADLLRRLAEIRESHAAAVTDALGAPDRSAEVPTVEELLDLLAGDDRVPGGTSLHVGDRAKFDLAVERSRALGCVVGDEKNSNSWEDPQGGEDWWVMVEVTCADGPAELRVMENYTPMY